MKQMVTGKLKGAAPPPPPPPPPLPNFWTKAKPASTVSVTNQEIARFWRQKRIDEEEHLLFAIKAAARIRAQKLTEEDYKLFEEALQGDQESKEDGVVAAVTTTNSGKTDDISKELRIGIKDWWTKSKYAYLNQPAIETMDPPKRGTSTYIPNFCNYKPAPLPTASFGIF